MAINMYIPCLDENNVKRFCVIFNLVSAEQRQDKKGIVVSIDVALYTWDSKPIYLKDEYVQDMELYILDNRISNIYRYIRVIGESPIPEVTINELNDFINTKVRYFVKHLTEREIESVMQDSSLKLKRESEDA